VKLAERQSYGVEPGDVGQPGPRRQLEQDGDGEQNEQCPAAPLEVMRRQDA
jgi:hypothetical protein